MGVRDNRDIDRDNYELKIENYQKILDDYKTQTKDRLYEYYNQGKISNEYLTERYKRIDRNNFTLPPMYKYNKLPKQNDYVRSRHRNTYNTLSNDEKKTIFNNYKMECKEERRQFILRNYLIEKGFVQKCDFKSDAYDRHLEQKEERLNETLGHERAQINILENDIANEVGNREMAFEEPFFERIEKE